MSYLDYITSSYERKNLIQESIDQKPSLTTCGYSDLFPVSLIVDILGFLTVFLCASLSGNFYFLFGIIPFIFLLITMGIILVRLLYQDKPLPQSLNFNQKSCIPEISFQTYDSPIISQLNQIDLPQSTFKGEPSPKVTFPIEYYDGDLNTLLETAEIEKDGDQPLSHVMTYKLSDTETPDLKTMT